MVASEVLKVISRKDAPLPNVLVYQAHAGEAVCKEVTQL